MILDDQKILALKSIPEYRSAMRLRLKGLAHSFSGRDERDLSTLPVGYLSALGWVFRFYRKRIIEKEVFDTSVLLFEKIINSSSPFPDTDTVRNICERRELRHIWMRFDEKRIDVLFKRVSNLIVEPEVRVLIKRLAESPALEVDESLSQIEQQLKTLRRECLTVARSHLALSIVRRQEWDQNQPEIVESFLKMTRLTTSMKSVRDGTKHTGKLPPEGSSISEKSAREGR